MTTRFVCLANSYKEGGRCIAGIELDINDNPLIKNGHPKWIRPVCTVNHGEVPLLLVYDIHILGILEIKITGYPDLSFQSENAFFEEGYIKKLGKFSIDKLDVLCRDMPTLFGNKGKAVSEEKIEMLSYSLMFFCITDFTVNEKKMKTARFNFAFYFRITLFNMIFR